MTAAGQRLCAAVAVAGAAAGLLAALNHATLVLPMAVLQCAAVPAVAVWLHPPSWRTTAGVAIPAALAADLLLDRVSADSFRPLAGVLSLGIVAVLLGQVLRRDRTEVLVAAASGAGGLLVAAPAALAIGLRSLPSGPRPVTAIAVAALVGGLPWLTPAVAASPGAGASPGSAAAGSAPGPRLGLNVAGESLGRVVAGVAAAALVCLDCAQVEPFDGALVGLAAAGAAAVVSRLLRLSPSGAPAWSAALATGLAPLLVGIAAGAVAGRVVLG